jgi:hypothetical protein
VPECKHKKESTYKDVYTDMQEEGKVLKISPFLHKVFCLLLHHALYTFLFKYPDNFQAGTPTLQ